MKDYKPIPLVGRLQILRNMKSYVRDIALAVMVAVALIMGSGKASAQSCCDHTFHHAEVGSEPPRMGTEWGIGVGAVYTGLSGVSSPDILLSPRFGFQGHLDMAICFGRNFAIEVELDYEGGSIDAKYQDLERRIRTTSVDIPLLLSLRLANKRVRINAGPVFCVKSKGEYTHNNEAMMFGSITPTWNIAGGIGVRLSRYFLIEARYIHALTDNSNQFGGTEQNAGLDFNTRSYKVTLGVSLVF